jgi:hypothetical protein
MLIIWGIFWGAIIGACWPGSSEEATSIGVIFGFLAGLSLHFAIKRQVAQGHKTLSQQLQAQIAAAKLGSPVPKVPPPAAAPAFSASAQTASVPSPAFPRSSACSACAQRIGAGKCASAVHHRSGGGSAIRRARPAVQRDPS